MRVGIEKMNLYPASFYIDIRELFEYRGLELDRFDNLMIKEKSVALPCEDVVSFAVNAAKPLIDQMSEEDRQKIEVLIVATESGVDFGKSVSTYVHKYLGLPETMILFEVKQACFAATAALEMAASYVRANAHCDAKVLVISSDLARVAQYADGSEDASHNYAEPSQGAAAVAMCVGLNADLFEIDWGAKGMTSYEVWDTCRPTSQLEIGDADTSLNAYLDCLARSYEMYTERVEGEDLFSTFDYLSFHTPFPGMVKGGHRFLARKQTSWSQGDISKDFLRRVQPSIDLCTRLGNAYSATLYVALCSVMLRATFEHRDQQRVGMFSYGSGCSSQFYSGVISQEACETFKHLNIEESIDQRVRLSMSEYEAILKELSRGVFGIKDLVMDQEAYLKSHKALMKKRGLLILKEIKDYYREYEWI